MPSTSYAGQRGLPKNHVPHACLRARFTHFKHIVHVLLSRRSIHIAVGRLLRMVRQACHVLSPPYTTCAQPNCSQASSTVPPPVHDDVNLLECHLSFVFNRHKHRSQTNPIAFYVISHRFSIYFMEPQTHHQVQSRLILLFPSFYSTFLFPTRAILGGWLNRTEIMILLVSTTMALQVFLMFFCDILAVSLAFNQPHSNQTLRYT